MSNLLPPNSTAIERKLAAVNARISDIATPIAETMDADAIPLVQLPWLAWHMGVDAWKNYWPQQTKRARVKSSISIARKNGTAAAVRAVVATFGGNIALREWFQMDPPGVPGTFDVVLTVSAREGQAPSAALIADIIAEIDRTKPVRAHYTFTQGFGVQSTQGVAVAVRPALFRRLSFTDI